MFAWNNYIYPRSRRRSILSNAALGSARVHTVRIRGEQNGTVLSISPSPAEPSTAGTSPFASTRANTRAPACAWIHVSIAITYRYHARSTSRPRCTRNTCSSGERAHVWIVNVSLEMSVRPSLCTGSVMHRMHDVAAPLYYIIRDVL